MSQTGRRLAILIGSSKFEKEGLKDRPLKCPERDVDGMHELLASAELGAFNEVFVFKNSHHQAALDQIDEVLSTAARDDQVLIYYSGHGETDLRRRLYLAATNTDTKKLVTTSIPIETLRTLIENSDCRKIILILDCCFGGAAGTSFVKGNVDENLKELARGYGIYILTASTAAQIAHEREGDDYGLLTKHIIAGIREGTAANDDGAISMDGLYRYVYAKVTGEGHQEPMRWALNVKGEDLIIARTKKTPERERQRLLTEKLVEVRAYLPPMLFADAVRVVEQRRAPFYGLVDELYRQQLTTGEFIEEWYRLASPQPVKQSKPNPLLTVAKSTEPFVRKLLALAKSRVGLMFLGILVVVGILLYWQPQWSLLPDSNKTITQTSQSPATETPATAPAKTEVLRFEKLVEVKGTRLKFMAARSGYLYVLAEDKGVRFWLLTDKQVNRMEAGKPVVFPAVSVDPLNLDGEVPLTLIFSSQRLTNPKISGEMYSNLTPEENKRFVEWEQATKFNHKSEFELLPNGGIVTAFADDDIPLIALIAVKSN